MASLKKTIATHTHTPSVYIKDNVHTPLLLVEGSRLLTAVCVCLSVCVSPAEGRAIRMAQLLDGAGKLGWVVLKAVVRFVFMFVNNCVAIPSYCLYLLLLQPLRVWDRSAFWHLEGVMFKWLLAMVSSWGWVAGYTGELFLSLHMKVKQLWQWCRSLK